MLRRSEVTFYAFNLFGICLRMFYCRRCCRRRFTFTVHLPSRRKSWCITRLTQAVPIHLTPISPVMFSGNCFVLWMIRVPTCPVLNQTVQYFCTLFGYKMKVRLDWHLTSIFVPVRIFLFLVTAFCFSMSYFIVFFQEC